MSPSLLWGILTHDIKVDGHFSQEIFKGTFKLDDKNARVDFEGYVNLSDSLPSFDFTAQVDTLALMPLNLLTEPVGLSLEVDADFSGNTPSSLNGKMLLSEILLQNLENSVDIDSVLVVAGESAGIQYLNLLSPFLKAGIRGKYNVVELPQLLESYVNEYFALPKFVNARDASGNLRPDSDDSIVESLVDQQFSYYVHLSDPVPMVRLFDPALVQLDTASLVGSFDSKAKFLEGELLVPEVEYVEFQFDRLQLTVDGDSEKILFSVAANNVYIAGQDIKSLDAKLNFSDQQLAIGFDSYVGNGKRLLQSKVDVAINTEGHYVASLEDSLVVLNQGWRVSPENRIEFGDNHFEVEDLSFENGGQLLDVQTGSTGTTGSIPSLSLVIQNFNLEPFTQIAPIEDLSLNGVVDGEIDIRNYVENPYYVVGLTAKDIQLNNKPVGTLELSANSQRSRKELDIAIKLNGENNRLSLNGNYGISDGAIAISGSIEKMEIRLLDPFTVGVLSNNDGFIEAEFALSGSLEVPKLDGFFGFNQAKTTLDLLGTRVEVDDSQVRFSENSIVFDNFKLHDAYGGAASIIGEINHEFFADFAFNLQVQTDKFTVLDTEPDLSELYFGKAIVSSSLSILGNVGVPEVRGQVTTNAGTDISIVPLLSTASIAQEDWIIYANPYAIYQDSAREKADLYTANTLGLNLGLALTVDESASLNVIVDPLTGDALKAKGDADLNIQLTPNGQVSVTGLYEIVEGAYQFTFESGGFKVKQFDFEIEKGSSLRFIGDPLSSQFNIGAAYKTKTSTATLLSDNAQGTQVGSAQRRQQVHVLMDMSGTLNEPDIQLFIDVPEAGGSGLTNEVQRVLDGLTTQQTYEQVFSLLLFNEFNSFEGGTGSGFSASSAGEQLALSSISQLVASKLNELADDYAKGIDINIGLETYENNYTAQRQSSANFDLSKSLFRDRLTITLGTDVNVSSSSVEYEQATGIQSNFIVSYKLTESGKYLLRVFRRPDYSIISTNTPYENGVGIGYKRKWD